jgi:hypothetical protein
MQTNVWATVLSVAFLTLAAPLAAAQVGTFGSQVKVGDLDFLPVTKKASFMPAVYWIDSVGAGRMGDLCVLVSQSIYKTIESAPTGGATGTGNPSSSIAGVDSPPAAYQPSQSDIRLTGCKGAAAGSTVSATDAASTTYALATPSTITVHSAQVTFQYFDANGNAKYDTGDTAYLVNNPANAGKTGGAVAKGVVANLAAGAWSVRLTPFGTLPAGAPVLPSDADFNVARGQAKFVDLTMAQREDKGWYLMPAKPAAVAAASPIPAFSIRIATAGLTSLQPNIVATSVVPATPDAIAVGKSFPIVATVANTGGTGGLGLLVTKLDHQIVDARLSPLLSPGETATLLITVPAPSHGGILELEVNDNFQPVSVQGGTVNATAAAPSGELAALQAQVAQLQQQLLTLQSGGAVKQQGAPALAPLAVLGALVVVALAVRRRAE